MPERRKEIGDRRKNAREVCPPLLSLFSSLLSSNE
jgi:hypothetical protein